jgi:hypothetical protein
MMGSIKLFKQHPQGNQADEWGVQASCRQVLPAGQMVGDVIGARQWVCSDTDPLCPFGSRPVSVRRGGG